MDIGKKQPQIGEMVRLSAFWKKQGKTQAIQAWRHKNPALNFFSHHEPEKSEDYEQWFQTLSNSTGYVTKIDDKWTKVRFFCFEHELWFRTDYLTTIKQKEKHAL